MGKKNTVEKVANRKGNTLEKVARKESGALEKVASKRKNTLEKAVGKRMPLAVKVILAVLGVIIVGVAIALAMIRPWESTAIKETAENSMQEEKELEKVEGIDYEQKITNVDGGEFSPKIVEGQEANLEMRFSDLKCDENCENVDNVEFSGKKLERGKDFEVKQGSVIIVIFATVFDEVEPGEVTVTFEITEDDKIRTIGVKITVEKKAEEEKEDAVAEKQNNGGKRASGNTSSTSSKSGASSGKSSSATTDATEAARIACESRTDGPYGMALVHFVSASEKKEGIANLGWGEDTVATVSVFSGSNMKMKYVNGVCRPSPSSSTDMVGIGAQPFTKKQLLEYGITQTSDLVQWQYSDGHVERQAMSNLNQVWSW